MTTKHDPEWSTHYINPKNNWEIHPAAQADGNDQAIRLTEHYGDVLNNHDERHSVYAYTSTAYRDINNQLAESHKNGTDPDYGVPGMHHRNIQQVFRDVGQTHSVPEDVHAYAGFSPSKFMRSALGGMKQEPGEEVHFPAYTSTSIAPDTAMGWARDVDPVSGAALHHVAHFHIPKGHKGAMYIGFCSKHPIEQEMLLNAGTKATFLGKTTHEITATVPGTHPAHPKFSGVTKINPPPDATITSTVHMYHFKLKED